MHLTDRAIRGLKPKPGQRERVVAERGLEVVATRSRKMFRARIQIGAKVERCVLGDYPGMSLAEARDEADIWRHQRQGIGALPEHVRGSTVKDLLDEWDRIYLQRERRVPEEPIRAIEKDVIPIVGDMKLAEVTRRDLVLVLDNLVERGSPGMADHLRSMLIQMFDFGVERGLLEESPARRLPKARKGRNREARDRVLNDEELRRLWWGLATEREAVPGAFRKYWFSRVRPYTKRALRLLLLTGVRRSEAVLAEWSEIDFENALWTIPGPRTKTFKDHVVPLSDLAVEILEEQQALTGGRRWVFASPNKDFTSPILVSSVSQAVNDNYPTLKIAKFVPHDLRRTVRSRLSALGVDHVVCRKVLNHSLDGMDAIYDRHEYLDEKRDALQRWANELRRILGSESSVVSITRAAR